MKTTFLFAREDDDGTSDVSLYKTRTQAEKRTIDSRHNVLTTFGVSDVVKVFGKRARTQLGKNQVVPVSLEVL